jgi:RNA polymerase sigma-70 factor (ECF subfamily)
MDDAFREIYERHYRDVYRFALFLSGDPSKADDLTAETFIRAWTARDRIRHASVRAYLLTIARNLHRDQQRASRRFMPLEDRFVDDTPRPDEQAVHVSSLRQVRAGLRDVARGDRRALLLYAVRGLSYAQVATALGVSIGAVKSRICRARDALVAFRRGAAKGSPNED